MTIVADLARRNANAILHGTVLAIDPSSGGSSYPGWATFERGELTDSGTLRVAHKDIYSRLRELSHMLVGVGPDVLVIEQLRGGPRTHIHLLWSVGAVIATVRSGVVIEMPVPTWRKFAGKSHIKSDQGDAEMIGHTLVALARMKVAA